MFTCARGVCMCCYTMVYKLTKTYTNDILHKCAQRISSSCIRNCKYMTLAIGILDNIFPFILKWKKLSYQVSECATLHDYMLQCIWFLTLFLILMLTYSMKLTIIEHDTLRPRGIQLMPFANSIPNTKYHTWCRISPLETTFPKEKVLSLLWRVVKHCRCKGHDLPFTSVERITHVYFTSLCGGRCSIGIWRRFGHACP